MLSYTYRNNGFNVDDIVQKFKENFSTLGMRENEHTKVLYSKTMKVIINKEYTYIWLNRDDIDISIIEEYFFGEVII